MCNYTKFAIRIYNYRDIIRKYFQDFRVGIVHHVHAYREWRGGRSKQTSVVQHRLPLYAGTGLRE